MIHQHLFETGQDVRHAGQPWCDCVMRLNERIARKAIFASPTTVRKIDGRSIRLNLACAATGRASLSHAADRALAAFDRHRAWGAVG